MTRFSSIQCCLLVAVVPMGTACAVDTYEISVESREVQEGTLSLQLDTSGSEPMLHAALLLRPTRTDACPTLGDDATIVLEQDGARTELRIESRGDGFMGIDCAFKCHHLVAFEAKCTPVAASLRGADVEALIGGGDARTAFEDASGSRGVTLDIGALEPRGLELPGGANIVVERNAPTEYRFTIVPFEWSSPDTSHWVGQWANPKRLSSNGNISAFNIAPPGDDAEELAFSIRGDASAGRHTVYFSASAPAAGCDVAVCEGIEHLVSHELTVAYP